MNLELMLCERQNISVDRLCKIAGYNRCTFYRYYSDIQELHKEVENSIAKQIFRTASEIEENADLEKFIEHITTLHKNEGELIFVLLENHPTFIQMMKEQMKPLIRKHCSIDERYNEDLAISFISTAISQTIVDWYRNGRKESAYDISRFIISALQKGVLK